MLKPLRDSSGFTLIELMVVVAVFVMLLMAAMPSMGAWVVDARIRSTAESLQNGLRLAQAEALRRNRRSAFVLTSATPALGATPVANGGNWFARTLLLSGSDESDDASDDAAAPERFIDGGRFAASSVNITGPALLCFGPLGRQIDLDAQASGLGSPCEAADPRVYVVSSTVQGTRTLQVQVNASGRVRMCDPARKLIEGQPDGC
jgi:type IV fimbrial biogenesis protein FimT